MTSERLALLAAWGLIAYAAWHLFVKTPRPPRTWYAGIEGEGRG